MPSHNSYSRPTSSVPSSPYSPTISHGLPSEEYKALQRRHTRQCLESHFTHRGSATKYASPRTAYQSADMPSPKRSHISAMQNATRHALGPSFDFTQHSFEKLAQRDRNAASTSDVVVDEKAGGGYDRPVPQRYIDAFNRKWAEDDAMYDSTQACADRVPAAAWRQHADMPTDIAPDDLHVSLRNVSRADSAHAEVRGCSPVSRGHGGRRPEVISRFSSDSDVSVAIPRRSMLGLRR